MQIERQSVPGAEVLAIQGQLDATTAPQLEGALEDAADYGGGQPLVVDLAGVGLISSAALRVLLTAAKRARKESGKIHLCAANPEVRKVFEISGLAALFDLHNTREEALESAGVTTEVEPSAPAPAIAAPLPSPVTFPPPGPAPSLEPEHHAEPEPEPEPADLAPTVNEPTNYPATTIEASIAPPPPVSAPAPPAPPVLPPPIPPIPPAVPVSPPAPFVPPLPVTPLMTAATPPPPVPPPARARAAAAPPPPVPARSMARTTPPAMGAAGGATKRPFPVFPLLAGLLGLGLLLAAAAYFLFNRLAPKTGYAGATPAPTVAPDAVPTPAAGPSILPMDAPTPESTPAAPEPTVAAGSEVLPTPTPTPTPAVVAATDAGPEINRVAAPTQVNFDPSDPRNSAVREAVLKRIESMPVSRKVKDQLYAALERARGMGKVATITFGAGRTDLSAPDVELLRKGLSQPVTARLASDPTVVIVVLGYADTKGDAAVNRKISEQRAARTMEALKGPCGLLNIMHSVGMGASELLDGKNTDANRAVEVWVVQP